MSQDNWCYHARALSCDVTSLFTKSIWLGHNSNLHILSVPQLLPDIQVEVCKFIKHENFQKNSYIQLSLLFIHACHSLHGSDEYNESHV
jgi:hypothetical protein